jgi:hypothetical protein
VADAFWGAVVLAVLAWLMVMYAVSAKNKWMKRQQAGG